jgi:hypothetical protein
MFLLIDQSSGGVYAVQDRKNGKVVQMFEEKDDAERYLGLLVANTTGDEHNELQVIDIDQETVVRNCEVFGYNYCIIKPEDIVFPP